MRSNTILAVQLQIRLRCY